jgi:acyl-CoA synthetase (AMP-forming)/AMP-acid ligase II
MTAAVETLNQALERAASFPHIGVRLLDRREAEEWLPWREIAARARAVAWGLWRAGVERGERVGLVYPTSAEFLAAFFGALGAGAVPVPLYPPLRLGRLGEYQRQTARMLETAGAVLVLAQAQVRSILGEAVEMARPRLGCRTLADLEPGAAELAAVAPDELGLVQFSSGTTVDPKPVALSHRALLAQVEAINSLWPDAADRAAGEGIVHSAVSWLPLYHDMGLIGILFSALFRPAMATLIGPEAFVARPAIWLRALSRHRATVSAAPNFAYALATAKIRDEELAGVDLSSWRLALDGAEPVVPEVLRAFQERFARWGLRPEALTPVYGLSEAALAVTVSDLDRPFRSRRFDRRRLAEDSVSVEAPDGRELVSVGRPVPGMQLEVRDPRGERLGESRVGRVWVRGPSLMRGYLGQPRATAAALVDGWLDTGDLGFLLGGELYLTGRAKDLLILRGRNHAPEEVEAAVAPLADARPGCVVAASYLPEGASGEALLLFVEARRRSSPAARAALPEACRRAVLLATGLAVDEVLVLEPGTLPRTSSGKYRRQETLRRHLAGELRPPDRVSPLRLARAMARSHLAYARLRLQGGGGRRGRSS